VRNSTDTVQWLHGRGVRFVPRFGRYAFKHEGKFKFFGGTVVEAAGGGRGLVQAEYKAAEKLGITIRYAAQATDLLRGLGGVQGVRIVVNGSEEEIRSKAVVLAAGGFEANREWRTRYLGPGWDMAKVRGTRYNTGDGLRMALDIGAQAFGQWPGCHSVSWERYAPDFGDLERPIIASRNGYPFGIMVNADGKRFVDEGADLRNYTYAKYGRVVLEQPGSYAWHVFDSQVDHLLHDEYRSKGTTKVQADTLEELVARMEDVHPAQFLQMVREFNAAVTRDVAFNPNIKDGKCTTALAINKSNWANPIEKPPYSAYAVTCGITFTFGGLKIDTTTRVLDIEDLPLPGLYAAGELVGGLFYFNYPGSSGLMAGSVFGRIAGREAAAHATGARSRAA
jgi:tricarballylate dehydrogenase